MKKLIIALFLPIVGLAQLKQPGFAVRGNLQGLKDSTKVFLVSGTQNQTIATATSKNGQFELTGMLPGPDLFQLGFTGAQQPVELFIANDNVTITGNVDELNKVEIKGSVTQSDYQLFRERFDPLKDKLNALAAQINQEQDPTRKNAMIGEFNKYKVTVLEKSDEFMKEKPASPVSSFVLFIMSPLMGSLEEIESRFKQLSPVAHTTSFAMMIDKNLADAKVNAIGTQAIAFTQKDTASRPVSLASFKGKYVLIDFWASWCKPCRMENPNVVSAYNQYKDKNFTVLGVSLDQDRGSWMQAIHADKLTWTHVSDLQYWNNEVAQLYRIQSIPANILIDPDGKIVGKDLREEALHRRLKELLNK